MHYCVLLFTNELPSEEKIAEIMHPYYEGNAEYDEETEKYSIHIPQEVPCNDLPAILSLLAKQGIREIDDKWARRFVKERVVPPDRQNIGMIMRELHMKKYSEFPILEFTGGRCCMDDFYLEEIK